MYAIATRILRDRVAWRQLPTLRDPDRFEAWVRRLVVHACYAEARHRRVWAINVRVLPVGGPAAPDDLISVDDRFLLDAGGGRPVLIDIAAPAADFEEFLPAAMEVVQTFEFN